MTPSARPSARRARGLTLIETMVAVAIVAVMASLAVPSFGAQLARTHLKAAAERLAADLAEARFEAGRRGTAMHVHFETGAQWCYSVAMTDPCACGTAQACQLRHVEGREHPNVSLTSATDLHFDPANGSLAGTGGAPAAATGAVTLRSSHGDLLRVELTRLGRAKVCAPASKSLGYPAC